MRIKKRKTGKTKCNLCGSTKFRLVFISKDRMFGIPDRFKVVKCQKCGLIFLNPQPTKKALQKHYPEDGYYSYQTSESEGFFAELRRFLIFKYYGGEKPSHFEDPGFLIKALAVFIRKVPAIPRFETNARILDIGCGSGETLAQLKNLGWQTFGIEIDRKAVSLAKREGLESVTQGSFEKIGKYPDAFFDVIRLYHVLEHLPDLSLCLKLAHQKLKRGGEVIIGVPNIDSFAGRIFGTYWYNLDSPRHLFVFSQRTLKALLEKTGFKIVKEEYCSAGGLLGSIQYFINERLGLKINLINRVFLVFLIYPLEWFLDRAKFGDVIVLTAKKQGRKGLVRYED